MSGAATLKRLRQRLHAVASRHFEMKGEKAEYRAFLAANFAGRTSSLSLKKGELEEAVRFLSGGRFIPRAGAAAVPLPSGPAAKPRRKRGKVYSLAAGRRKTQPPPGSAVKKLFAYAYNRLGWDNALIRANVLRLTGKDIRDVEDLTALLTVQDVNRVMGSLRSLYRHHGRLDPAYLPETNEKKEAQGG